jgi:hypothetical protein
MGRALLAFDRPDMEPGRREPHGRHTSFKSIPEQLLAGLLLADV